MGGGRKKSGGGRKGGGRGRGGPSPQSSALSLEPKGDALLVRLHADIELHEKLEGKTCPAAIQEADGQPGMSLRLAALSDVPVLFKWFKEGLEAEPHARLLFSPLLNKNQRSAVHKMATSAGLGWADAGEGEEGVTVTVGPKGVVAQPDSPSASPSPAASSPAAAQPAAVQPEPAGQAADGAPAPPAAAGEEAAPAAAQQPAAAEAEQAAPRAAQPSEQDARKAAWLYRWARDARLAVSSQADLERALATDSLSPELSQLLAAKSALLGPAAALVAAAAADDAAAVEELVAAQPELLTSYDAASGQSGLTAAARAGAGGALAALLAAGADPGAPDGNGVTPLVAAREGGHAAVEAALLAAGTGSEAAGASGGGGGAGAVAGSDDGAATDRSVCATDVLGRAQSIGLLSERDFVATEYEGRDERPVPDVVDEPPHPPAQPPAAAAAAPGPGPAPTAAAAAALGTSGKRDNGVAPHAGAGAAAAAASEDGDGEHAESLAGTLDSIRSVCGTDDVASVSSMSAYGDAPGGPSAGLDGALLGVVPEVPDLESPRAPAPAPAAAGGAAPAAAAAAAPRMANGHHGSAGSEAGDTAGSSSPPKSVASVADAADDGGAPLQPLRSAFGSEQELWHEGREAVAPAQQQQQQEPAGPPRLTVEKAEDSDDEGGVLQSFLGSAEAWVGPEWGGWLREHAPQVAAGAAAAGALALATGVLLARTARRK